MNTMNSYTREKRDIEDAIFLLLPKGSFRAETQLTVMSPVGDRFTPLFLLESFIVALAIKPNGPKGATILSHDLLLQS